MIEKIWHLLSANHDAEFYILIIFVLLTGFLFGASFRRYFYKILSRFHRGKRKSRFKKALKLLLKNGYGQIEENVSGKGHIRWNNQIHLSTLIIDLVARKDDEVHGFIIKSGDEINAENADTRRELLEVFVNYELDSLYLINMDTMKLNKIDFVLNPKDSVLLEEEAIKNWHWLLIGLAFGYIIAKAISF